MTKAVCSTKDCPTLIDKGTRGGRCPTHERVADQARGTTTERGYGADHMAERRAWVPIIGARQDTDNPVRCVRCTKPLTLRMQWHLDHNDDRTAYLGPSHKACNLSAAGSTPRNPQ